MKVIINKIPAIVFLILFNVAAASHVNALCVYGSKANLRTGPGTNYEIAWEVYKYMPFLKVGMSLLGTKYSKSFLSPARQYDSFKVLQRKGKWVKVKDKRGDVGWIHGDYLWIQ